jgi:hypothetical protein
MVSQPKFNDDFVSYQLTKVFIRSKHRSLKDALGFQTYITCAVKGEEISINSYINPQVYN